MFVSQAVKCECQLTLGHFEFHWKNAWRVWSNLSWQVFFIFAQELTKSGEWCAYTFFLYFTKEEKNFKKSSQVGQKIGQKNSWQPIWDTLYVLFIKFFNLIWNKRQIKKVRIFSSPIMRSDGCMVDFLRLCSAVSSFNGFLGRVISPARPVNTSTTYAVWHFFNGMKNLNLV